MTDFPTTRPGQFRVKLEEVTPTIVAAYADTLCLIWSGEHGAWWRAGCAGYTTAHAAAGRYTLSAAYAATNHCDPSKGIAFERIEDGPAAAAAKPATTFQQRVQPWLIACFSEMIAGDREERNHRFLEEGLELVQAAGCTASEAHQLVDYVFGRPTGEPAQEVGGVMVTLAALCLANDLDMHAAAEAELERVWTKVEAIRAKQAAKPKHSPLPGYAETIHPDDEAVDRFAAQMKAKLAKARAKGRGGWDDPAQCDPDLLRVLLHEHVAKGDPVDVANFCMMLDHYGALTVGVIGRRSFADAVGA